MTTRPSLASGARSRRAAPSRLLLLGLAVGALFTCGPSLTRQDLLCEEAAAQLSACCGTPPARFLCHEDRGSCGGGHSFDDPEARCILDRDCLALQEGGVCARLEADPVTRPICP